MNRSAVLWLGLIWAALAGCSPSPCGPGTELKGAVCVPVAAITCGPGTVEQAGKCVAAADGSGGADSGACVPLCAPKDACGDDGCGGSCGDCKEGLFCVAGTCQATPTCIPDCTGKNCGSNGCGGSCGSCSGGDVCTNGVCALACVPNCIGRGCGPDGCGGTCGSCDGGLVCSKDQLCLPEKWTCASIKYGGDAQCDCGCGAEDPDCAKPELPVLGCEPYHLCSAGVCTPAAPKTWTCSPALYGDKISCDCGCGAPDPDCAIAGAFQVGCSGKDVCGADGKCAACVPNCKDKLCGDDGCGGVCGQCPEPALGQAPLACVGGKCVDGCAPTPLLCKTNTCGDDGCGGSCGTCKAGEFCNGGKCLVMPGKSCKGYCKGKAPGGCSCAADCEKTGSCCPDFVAECVCVPKCDGKTCGEDGCGGTCGACGSGATPWCGLGGQCVASCQPQCVGKSCGDDGCGGTCGSCPSGGQCTGNGLCAPASWVCPAFWYADGSFCDCSCGAADPDCAKVALTNGCPAGFGCVKDTGLCNVAFCGHDGDCKAPNWCVGNYPAGGGLRKGVCQLPNPASLPAGSPCSSDLACASGLCAAGQCRVPCQTDAHCKNGAVCLGFARSQGLTGSPLGVIGACDSAAQVGAACSSQAGCAATKQKCLAFVNPSSLKADLRCGSLSAASEESAGCGGPGDCAPGLVCAGGKCGRPCPAGAADCPAGYQCKPAALHGGLLSGPEDDVNVPTCSK